MNVVWVLPTAVVLFCLAVAVSGFSGQLSLVPLTDGDDVRDSTTVLDLPKVGDWHLHSHSARTAVAKDLPTLPSGKNEHAGEADFSTRLLLLVQRGQDGVRNVVHAVFRLRGGGQDFVWPPLELSARLVVACILGAIGACLSSAGGVGGGGLYVPIFNLLVGFDSKTATSLSNFMILGGSISNVGITLQQRHPELDGEPLLDYDAAMLLQPNVLLGISLGVLCNTMFPAWSITALLAVTLFYMASRSLRGAIRRWSHESRRMAAQAEELARAKSPEKQKVLHPTETGNGDLQTPLLEEHHHHKEHLSGEGLHGHHETAHGHDHEKLGHDDAKSTALFLSIPDVDSEEQPPGSPGDVENPSSRGTASLRRPKLTRDLTMEKVFNTIGAGSADEHCLHDESITPGCFGTAWHRQYPLKKLGVLAVVWLVFFAVQVIRGDLGQKLLHFENCGLVFWLLTACQIPIAVGFTFWAARHTHNSLSDNTLDPHQDEHPTFAQTAGGLLPVMAFLAGLLGGLLGIGGGMVINPLLLEIGMLPQVTAATCAFMVFFSSSMSVVQYWLLGRIPFQHGVLFAAICLVASFVGQIAIQRIIVRCGRASVIVFSVSIVIGLSAIATAGFGGYEVIVKYLAGEYMGFHRPC